MALKGTKPRRVEFKVRRVISKNTRVVSKVLDQLTREMTADLRKTLRAKQYPPPSSPGTIPAQRTGGLANNTSVERKGRKLFVRTTQVGIWLDGGTNRMAARPWIRRRIHNRTKHWLGRVQKIAKPLRQKA